jgi:hypothetical protein
MKIQVALLQKELDELTAMRRDWERRVAMFPGRGHRPRSAGRTGALPFSNRLHRNDVVIIDGRGGAGALIFRQGCAATLILDACATMDNFPVHSLFGHLFKHL